MAERYSSFQSGTRLWFLQRVTAAFLVVVLAFHFFNVHFVTHAPDITFQGSQYRMQSIGYFITMVLFLVTATFHGVNGIYNALINAGLDGTQKRATFVVLAIASLLLVVQGLRVAVALAGF